MLEQRRRRREALAVTLREFPGASCEGTHADVVDELDRTTGPGRESPAEDRTDVRVARRFQHALVEAAHRLDRLRVEHPVLDVLERDRASAALEHLESGPQRLLAVLRVVVEPAAIGP